ncbi:MAG TPA: GntR family transcriptional regulator [Thermoanaerobaculia bacterium]|jgi:DNA-binding GntR family transcriptional regulator
MPMPPLVRRTLVDDACDRLREWILDGQLSPDDDLSEPRLASMLGISRTPVREAIARLSHEGLVEVDAGKGFRIARADASLVREIYPIIAALEAMALRLSAPDRLPDVAALRAVNDEIRAGLRSERLFTLDKEFHRLIVSRCPNARLLTALEQQRMLARRFDGASRRGMHKPLESRNEHAAIIEDIARKRVDRAAQRIEQHYLDGIEVVIDWMSSRRKSEGK